MTRENARTILIVDDSAFTRSIHKRIIEAQGYRTLEAEAGTEAVDLYGRESPDLVMVDLLLPDMDGMEVIREIRKIDPEARLVVCSTDKQRYRKQEARELGVRGYFSKPVDPEALAETLTEIFSHG